MKSMGNPIIMKEINTNIIRSALRAERHATKQRLAKLTGLSTVTVATVLNHLLELKEVQEAELMPSSGGRPAQSFFYNGEYSHAVILFTHVQDGKDMVFYRVINLFGECVYCDEQVIDTIYVDSFEPIITQMISLYPTIQAIGFGLPGVEFDGVISTNDYQNLSGTRFLEYYQNKFGIPALFENDVNLAVLGYCSAYPSGNLSTVVYLYFPQKYPPGAGVCLNGTIYKGKNHFAGEINHMPFGIDWHSMDYSGFETVCDAISKLVLSYVCILDPGQIILHGEFLTEGHIQRIADVCRQQLAELFITEICISERFDFDFQQGMIVSTLNLLSPKTSMDV